MHERRQELNRLSSWLIVFLSITALLAVLPAEPFHADEGTYAHFFQLSILGLLPMILLSLVTAD